LAATRSRDRARRKDSTLDTLNLSSRERTMFTEYEEHRLSENLQAGRSFYAVTVQLEVGKLDTQYRALTGKLEDRGEIITTLPDTASAPTLVAFKLVFASQLKEADLKPLIKPYNGRVTRLGPSTWRRAGAALKSVGRKQKKSAEKSSGKSAGEVLPPAFAQESLQPLSPSVRVEMAQIDELSGLAHELSIEMQKLTVMADRFLQAAGFGAREQFDLRFSARRIEREFLELEERLVELRMVSLGQTFTRAARLDGRLARELGKSVSVEVIGRDTQLDKMIVDRVADSIYHVLRNAIDHGIEMPDDRRHTKKNPRGRIKIEAMLEGARAIIAITDDGRGIDPERVRARAIEAGLIAHDEELTNDETLRLLLRPGFSTADVVSALSGRGVGLDAVERTAHELGGEVNISSEQSKWTRFEISVPTTLVMISAFIVRVSDWRYAINVGQIVELLNVIPDEILGRDGRRSIRWREFTVPLVELKYLLGLGGARVLQRHGTNGDETESLARPVLMGGSAANRIPVFITRVADRYVAIGVEQFIKQREIIVKSLGVLARKIKGVIGAVDLEGGDVALVLDLPSLLILRSMRM
jgi:two-component system chemotaxis sensor kinase CheA